MPLNLFRRDKSARQPADTSTSFPSRYQLPVTNMPDSKSQFTAHPAPQPASQPQVPAYPAASYTPDPAPATRRPQPPAQPAPSEQPPAYQPKIAHGPDDKFSFLSTFDTVFVIDDSGSMAGRSWRETAQCIAAITPICTQFDADGIDIYFLNHPDSSEYSQLTRAEHVEQVFRSIQPRGGTPTGTKLNAILKPYIRKLEAQGPDAVKPLNIIVITDGEASDDVESVIVNAAKKLDKLDADAWQVGVQFFQVGCEPGAAEALRALDDDLGEMGVRDMVDTVPFQGGQSLTAEGILKVLMGAVNRKYDRKKVQQ